MKRRTFLKGVACCSAIATEEMLPGRVPRALAGACSDSPSAHAYSMAEPGDLDRATFDFYVEHKKLVVASTGREEDREAEFELIMRPISPNPQKITLNLVPIDMPNGSTLALAPYALTLESKAREIHCTAVMPDGVREGREALFKVVATRGEEQQEVNLQVRVATAVPNLDLGTSKAKVREQPLKVTVGNPVDFRLSLGNRGRLEDTFNLTVETPGGWTARLLDGKGRHIQEIKIGPIQGIFQWEDPKEIWLQVTPGPSAEPKKTVPVVVRAQSEKTSVEDELTVSIFLTPPLFSVNDLDGLDPRTHYLRPDSMTSYVLHLFNPGAGEKEIQLEIESMPAGWLAELSSNGVKVPPGSHEEVAVIVRAPGSATKGDKATVRIAAQDAGGTPLGAVRLGAEVYDLPKIYFLIIDSLDYKYLGMNRKGDGPGKEGDWLCPNIRAFMGQGSSFSEAHCGMPAATDMNHTTIMSGASTGTLGAYWVSGLYAGLDPVGDIIVARPNPDVLRYGSTGKKLPRIFDLVKDRYPSARSVVLSNKAWVSALHEDRHAVRWGITGSHFPVYAPPPPRFVLGDPPSDENPKDPRPVRALDLMVNYNPMDVLPQILHGDLELLTSGFQDIGEYVGNKPGFFPDDLWIADRARQVIREEDPEVLYVNLAAVDDAGHLFGAAWDPDEWSQKKGFLGSRQVSKYSEQARREETLDAVREADLRVREILDEIESRGSPEDSISVFTADHSMITEGYRKQGYAAVDLREYLREQGIVSPKHYGAAWSLNHYGAIFDVRDEDTLKEIKRQLQGMAVDDPEEGKDFHPCIVLDREGMKTGIDSDNPYLPESENTIALPSELYSSYYIKHPAPPGEKIRWPDLLIFFRGHYQGTVPGDAMIKGVNGVGQRMPVFRKTGSRWVGIHGSKGSTHVPIVFRAASVRKAHEVPSPATLHDILPTLCRMLGWEIPEPAAGKARGEILV